MGRTLSEDAQRHRSTQRVITGGTGVDAVAAVWVGIDHPASDADSSSDRAGPADGRDMILRRGIRAIHQKRGTTVRIEF